MPIGKACAVFCSEIYEVISTFHYPFSWTSRHFCHLVGENTERIDEQKNESPHPGAVPETADCVGNRFFKVKEPALIICLFKSPLTSLEAAVLRWSVNYSTFLTAESQWWRPSREVCVRIQQVPFTLMFWGNCRLTFSSNSFNVKGVFYLNNHNKNKKCPWAGTFPFHIIIHMALC